VQSFSCLDQFLCMTFAQFDVPGEPSGHRDMPARTAFQALSLRNSFDGGSHTLAHANAVRDWRIYADFAQSLMAIAPASVCAGTVRRRTAGDGLGARHDHHRSLSVGISVGAVPLG